MNYVQSSKAGNPVPATPDLCSRADKLEWWFVQGFIEGENSGRQHFMLSFFRQSGITAGPEGHMLLVATLEENGEAHAITSKVSPQLVDNFNRDAPAEVASADVDQTVARAILSEIKSGGPPWPIELGKDDARIEATPHRIDWDDFHFEQLDGKVELSFLWPGTDKLCHLEAVPQTAWFEGRDIGAEKTGFMAYDCCPRLGLQGNLGGKAVAGQAWMDHQWGGYGWITGPDGVSSVPGWDWLGINLDDGRALLVMVHRDMRTRETVAQSAVLFEADGAIRRIGNVSITGTRHWQSPGTMVDYPVACRIEIPELGAVLAFSPLVDNQEIPVFGLIGAIWEGAGKINGSIAGEAVSGRARLELHGYGYLSEFESFQKKWVARIDATILNFLPRALDQTSLESYLGRPRWAYDAVAQSRMMADPVWNLIDRGGKHWRPIFGLLLLEALGTRAAPHELMMSTVPELLHNGSVIIDDIEDSSPTRRGSPAIHLQYGVPTAINTGNTLYFLPLLTVARNTALSMAQQNAIYKASIEMFVTAHFGQAQDIYWSSMHATDCAGALADPATQQVILQTHAFKSAAAVRGVAEIACIIANSSDEVRRACVRLAESWGVAFQIIDDINNFSSSQRWGKLRGEDVHEGKFSYVIHKAVQMLEGPPRQRLLDILAAPALRQSSEGLAEAIGLIEQSGALAASRQDATRLYADDWLALSRLLPNSMPKFMLRAMMDKLLGELLEI